MPIYEYQCSACGHLFEAYVHTVAARLEARPCADCSKPAPYAGLSQVTVGKEGYFGLITDDGQRYRGSLPSQ